MITTSSIGTPSNYVGSNQKFTNLILKLRKRKKPKQITIKGQHPGNSGKYFWHQEVT